MVHQYNISHIKGLSWSNCKYKNKSNVTIVYIWNYGDGKESRSCVTHFELSFITPSHAETLMMYYWNLWLRHSKVRCQKKKCKELWHGPSRDYWSNFISDTVMVHVLLLWCSWKNECPDLVRIFVYFRWHSIDSWNTW